MMSKKEQVQVSKSEMIRQEFKSGLAIPEISKKHGIRYQMVYNVISEYCLKNGIEMPKRETGDSKKDRIIELYQEGKGLKQIAQECDTYYNYVSKVVSRFLAEK
jgi:transposase-like protein